VLTVIAHIHFLFPFISPLFNSHIPPSPLPPFKHEQTGMALGLVVLLLLSAYPGEAFDYSKPDGGRAEREAAVAGKSKKEEEEEEEEVEKVEVRVAADGCGSTMGSSSSSGSINSTITTTTTTMSVRHRRSHSKSDPKSTRGRNGSRSSTSGNDEHDGHDGQHAKAEALHRLLVQEDRVWQRLQHLPPAVRGMLGLSEDEVRLAVRQQQGGGNAGKGEGWEALEIGWHRRSVFYSLLSFFVLDSLRIHTHRSCRICRSWPSFMYVLLFVLLFVLPCRCVFFSLDSIPKIKGKILSSLFLSPITARIDLIFYLLAFSALIYVINMEYGHVATRLFTRFFPKEAAVLGV
jgi:hypothetical protein